MNQNETKKTAVCKVEWSGWDWDDYVQVQSTTGKVLRIWIVRAAGGWSFFTDAEQDLFRKLMSDGKWGYDRDVELTYDELAMFFAAYTRTNAKK